MSFCLGFFLCLIFNDFNFSSQDKTQMVTTDSKTKPILEPEWILMRTLVYKEQRIHQVWTGETFTSFTVMAKKFPSKVAAFEVYFDLRLFESGDIFKILNLNKQ